VYGGAEYAKSLDQSAQGVAVIEANRKWGEGPVGKEVIRFGVCKRGFHPYPAVNGAVPGVVYKAYGCKHHHATRRRRIEKVGVRPEWQSFDVFRPPAAARVVDENARSTKSRRRTPAAAKSKSPSKAIKQKVAEVPAATVVHTPSTSTSLPPTEATAAVDAGRSSPPSSAVKRTKARLAFLTGKTYRSPTLTSPLTVMVEAAAAVASADEAAATAEQPAAARGASASTTVEVAPMQTAPSAMAAADDTVVAPLPTVSVTARKGKGKGKGKGKSRTSGKPTKRKAKSALQKSAIRRCANGKGSAPRKPTQMGGPRVTCDLCGVAVAVTGLTLHMEQFHKGTVAAKRRRTHNSLQNDFSGLGSPTREKANDDCAIQCDQCGRWVTFAKYLEHWSAHF